jgi:hypothetical protein
LPFAGGVTLSLPATPLEYTKGGIGGGGGGEDDTVTVTELLAVFPHVSVTVTPATYTPLATYVCDGFCNRLVPPSAKLHEYV